MDNMTVVTIITFIGALASTLIPYLIKVYRDPEINFDINYGYALIISTAIQVIALIPDDVPGLTFKVMATAFASGYGLQAMLNKVVPK